jgi:hypothetical protein
VTFQPLLPRTFVMCYGNVMTNAVAPVADYRTLYARAFEEFGPMALWNLRRLDDPSPTDALAVAKALRVEGDRAARALAEAIEQASRAAH